MAKDFVVTVHDPERAAEWEQVYSSTTVYILSPITEWAMLPERGRSLVYMLDLKELTNEQRERLINHISEKFNIPTDQVASELDVYGVPILADDCTVTVHNPQRWLMVDEFDSDAGGFVDGDFNEDYYDDYEEDF